MKNCPAIRPQVATAEFGRTFDLLLGYKVGLAIWLVVVPHRLILLWSLCSKQEKKTLFVRKVKQDDRMVWQDIRERLLVMIQGTALLFHRCLAVGWSFHHTSRWRMLGWATSLSPSEFPFFAELYRRLKSDGIVFPVPTKDETAPILTPPPNVSLCAVACRPKLTCL